ncbi:kinetochore protein SPC24 homolog isoform X2 [Tasmannia lanceolata]|uniref:kinetochore protein SPC24 homolog isoform X2 n=1 Tax=Tasmannia lanceolata TaxID=3420 RepID=UPI00406306D5
MDGSTRKIDVQELFSYSDDLVQVLRNKKDINGVMQLQEGAKTLRSSCKADFSNAHNLLQEYQKNINACKQKIDEGRTEVIADSELEHLQNQLEEELNKEQLLRGELRTVSDEIGDLECERVSVEEQKKILKEVDKHESRQKTKLSMYASVTNIIPDFGDQTRISGRILLSAVTTEIVERNKKVVEKFEFETAKTPPLEICNSLWKMMEL